MTQPSSIGFCQQQLLFGLQVPIPPPLPPSTLPQLQPIRPIQHSRRPRAYRRPLLFFQYRQYKMKQLKFVSSPVTLLYTDSWTILSHFELCGGREVAFDTRVTIFIRKDVLAVRRPVLPLYIHMLF